MVLGVLFMAMPITIVGSTFADAWEVWSTPGWSERTAPSSACGIWSPRLLIDDAREDKNAYPYVPRLALAHPSSAQLSSTNFCTLSQERAELTARSTVVAAESSSADRGQGMEMVRGRSFVNRPSMALQPLQQRPGLRRSVSEAPGSPGPRPIGVSIGGGSFKLRDSGLAKLRKVQESMRPESARQYELDFNGLDGRMATLEATVHEVRDAMASLTLHCVTLRCLELARLTSLTFP